MHPAECDPVLQQLHHPVQGRGEGEVRGRLHQDLQDCHEAEDVQPHIKDMQEAAGQGVL